MEKEAFFFISNIQEESETSKKHQNYSKKNKEIRKTKKNL